MKTSNLLLLTLGIIIITSIVSVQFFPSIQDFMESNATWNGVKDFSNRYEVQNIDSLDVVTGSLEMGTLIAIPYFEYSPGDMEKLRQFIQRGGNLILMDDFGYGNSLLEYLGQEVRFATDPLLDPLFCYRNPDLPRITDFSEEIKQAGVNEIILNHATVLTNTGSEKILAWSSAESFLDINGNKKRDESEPGGPFPVAAEIGLGRGAIKLISDTGIIINSMIKKAGNQQFMQVLMEREGISSQIMLERSHLVKSPLDKSKDRLESMWKALASPYSLVGIMAVFCGLAIKFTYRKGKAVD